MAHVILRERWLRQPPGEVRLRDSHPLRPFIASVLRADTGRDAVDDAPLQSLGSVPRRITAAGVGRDHTTSSSALYRAISLTAPSVWIAGILVPDTTATGRKWGVATRSLGVNGIAIAISQGHAASSRMTLAARRVDNGTLLEMTDSVARVPPIGVPAPVFAITRGRTDHALYYAGAHSGFTNDAGTDNVPALATFSLGAGVQATAGLGFDGSVPLAILGTRDPGDAAIWQWLEAPWEIFEPRRRVVHFLPPVSGKRAIALLPGARLGEIPVGSEGIYPYATLVDGRVQLAREGAPLVLDQGVMRQANAGETVIV